MIKNISPAVAYICVDVESDGFSFNVIYGRYKNGHYCCIPNHGIGCDMSSTTDMFYNVESLRRQGLSAVAAKAIATAIQEAVRKSRGER